MKTNRIKRSNLAEQRFLRKLRDRPNWAKRSIKRVGDVLRMEGRRFSLRGRDDLGIKTGGIWSCMTTEPENPEPPLLYPLVSITSALANFMRKGLAGAETIAFRNKVRLPR